MTSKRGRQWRVSLVLLLPVIGGLLLALVAIPSVVVLWDQHRRMVLDMGLQESFFSSSHAVSLIESEVEHAVTSFLRRTRTFDLMNTLFATQPSSQTYVHEMLSALVATQFEESIMRVYGTIVTSVDSDGEPLAQLSVLSDTVFSSGVSRINFQTAAQRDADVMISPYVSVNLSDLTIRNYILTDTDFLANYVPVRQESNAVVRSDYFITPQFGFLAIALGTRLRMYRGVLENVNSNDNSGTHGNMVDVQMRRTFFVSDFQRVILSCGRPTPNSEVFLVSDGLILAAITVRERQSIAYSIPVSNPLRTPSGYSCYVDKSGTRFASCILQSSSVPILAEATLKAPHGYAFSRSTTDSSSKTVQHGIYRQMLQGTNYFVNFANIDIFPELWQQNLSLYVFTPVEDYELQYDSLTTVYIATSVVFVVLVGVIALGSWHLAEQLREFSRACESTTVSTPNPPKPAGLSRVFELRIAELDALRMMKRVVELSRTLKWMRDCNDLDANNEVLFHRQDGAHRIGDDEPSPAAHSGREADAVSEATSDNTAYSAHRNGLITSTGKGNNAFLMLSLVRRSLDPLLDTQTAVYPVVLKVLREQHAIVESVDQFTIVASFRSSQHALRAVECARTLTHALETVFSSLWNDDLKYCIACDVGSSFRFNVADILGVRLLGTLGGGALFPSRANPKRSFLSAESTRVLARLVELQATVLKSRVLITDRLMVCLPQRVAHLLTPVDFVEIALPRTPAGGTAMVPGQKQSNVASLPPQSGKSAAASVTCLRMVLYEDSMSECGVRTAYTTRRRELLAAALESLMQGELDAAIDHLRDFTGDATSADICDWHVHRWRLFVERVQLQCPPPEGSALLDIVPPEWMFVRKLKVGTA